MTDAPKPIWSLRSWFSSTWAKSSGVGKAVLVFGGLIFFVTGLFLFWVAWAVWQSRDDNLGRGLAVAAGIAGLVWFGIFASNGLADDDADVADSTATTLAPVTSTTTESSSTSSSVAELADYRIVEESDVSSPGALRISLRVTVGEGTTKEQVQAVAQLLQAQYRESHQYQAFSIFFYHFPELAFTEANTVGIWEDAPYGEWGRAAEAERGDYSDHLSVDKTRSKDWTLKPTQRDVDLWVAYSDTLNAMDTGTGDLPSDDEVFAVVADDFGIGVDEVDAAADAVLTWIFDG